MVPERKKRGRRLDVALGPPSTHVNPNTLRAYPLHSVESPCYFLCKKVLLPLMKGFIETELYIPASIYTPLLTGHPSLVRKFFLESFFFFLRVPLVFRGKLAHLELQGSQARR